MPKLNYDVRPTVSLNAGFEMNEDLMKHKIDFLLPLKSLKKDGPTVFVADIVMFWRSDIK
jgi:hypothetical protein